MNIWENIYINNNVKDTDDDSLVDGQDAGAVPARSTKTLHDKNVHGVTQRPPQWYYTENEWSRAIGWGKVPPERLWGGNRNRLTDEDETEESDT